MNEMTEKFAVEQVWATGLTPLAREVALMAGRLSSMLKLLFANNEKVISSAVTFLDHTRQELVSDVQLASSKVLIRDRLLDSGHAPICKLIKKLDLSETELELLILAGMAEEHEGYADIFKTFHPQTVSRPVMGLIAQLLCEDHAKRQALRECVINSKLLSKGILSLDGDGPFYNQSLVISNEVWALLQGTNQVVLAKSHIHVLAAVHGLEAWFSSSEVKRLKKLITHDHRSTVFITADHAEMAMQRAVSLVEMAGQQAICYRLDAEPNIEQEMAIYRHSLITGSVPVMQVSQLRTSQEPHLQALNDYPGPIIVCAQSGANIYQGTRTNLSLEVGRLSSAELKSMWKAYMPQLEDNASILASRYPVEPAQAQQVANDIRQTLGSEFQPGVKDVAEFLRARSASKINSSVQLIKPVADWQKLVLPDNKLIQLKEAVNRLNLQSRVLDEWGFLEGRRGARGVRMLFSGPPGTGKTLSAEVMARALQVDLLAVDLSRVVSKWIGETEKNLSEVFDTAEDSRAVLLFDEADALFGKRTEVTDSHDRYANLETAYLLARLERYDGLAVLSTNLQQNIDAAFMRRLEFVVEYQEPDRAQRLALWKCHLPDGVNLADDVSLHELAVHFPISGGLIRNAAVAAAFLAAADGEGILKKEHFVRAIRREYDKSGKAYRAMPGKKIRTVSGGK